MADETTLYLRRFPTRIARQAKAAAARRGTTLSSFVADAVERSLEGGATPASAVDGELAADMAWYGKNRARLRRRYDRQYVAIVDGAVIDHDREFEALASRVFERLGVRPVFMPRVGADDEVVHVRSPRFARS
jgi:hypothetical protein